MSLTGYRSWYAAQQPGTGWRLRSRYQHQWWDGPHLNAGFAPCVECPSDCPAFPPPRTVRTSKYVVIEACRCGIHAFRTERQNWELLSRDIPDAGFYPVAGVVKLWGKVVEHEHGFRAEHALIDRLWVPQLIVIEESTREEYLPGDICGFGFGYRSLFRRSMGDRREHEGRSYRSPDPTMLPALSRVYGVDVRLADRDCPDSIAD